MIEIYLEGDRITIYKDTIIAYNIQNNDVFNPSEIQITHTNRFVIPISPNLAILSNLGIMGHQSVKPYRELAIRIVEDGIEFYNDGKAIISRSRNRKDLEIIAKFEGGFFNLIKEQTLRELDFADINHTLNLAEFSNDEDEYFYPYNINFAKDKTAFELIYALPCIQEKKILDEIFDQNSWSLEWDDVAETKHEDTYLTPTEGVDQDTQVDLDKSFLNTFELDTQNITSNFDPSPADTTLGDVIDTQITAAIGDYLFINIEIKSFFITAASSTFSNLLFGLKWILEIDGTDVAEYDPYGEALALYDIDDTDYEIIARNQPTFSVHYYNTTTNPTLKLKLVIEDTPNTSVENIDIDYNTEIDINQFNYQISDVSIDFADIIPDTNQLTFLKDVINRYGLAVKKDKFSDKIILKRFENIFADRANAEDWSGKVLDENSTEYQSSVYGQTNNIKFNDEGLQGDFVCDNENLEAEKDIYTSEYGGLLSELDIYTEENGDFGQITDIEEGDTASKIGERSATSSQDISILGADRGSVTVRSLDALDMQDNVDDHYPSLAKIIERLERKEYPVRLSKVEMYNFDPFRLVYLRQEGAYFYVERIKNYRNNFGTAQLLKIPNEL